MRSARAAENVDGSLLYRSICVQSEFRNLVISRKNKFEDTSVFIRISDVREIYSANFLMVSTFRVLLWSNILYLWVERYLGNTFSMFLRIFTNTRRFPRSLFIAR